MSNDLHIPLSGPLLEVVVDTAAGLRTAVDNGADRVELVAALSEGGLTPSVGLMKLGGECGCPTRAMIRPRAGDFTYTADELHIMHSDIVAAASCGLEGVVLGANLTSGALDEAALKSLVVHAKAHGLAVAMHRGFDLVPDPAEALEIAISLGIDTLLTSGGGQTAAEGVEGLATLVAQAAGRIEILAGKGITAENVGTILDAGVSAIHASCNAPIPPHDSRAFALGYVNANMRDTDARSVAHLKSILTTRESLMNAPSRTKTYAAAKVPDMSFAETIGRLAKDDPAPLYLQLQRALRDAIQSRQLHQDDAIPPERDLAEEFDVSRITVRKAIDGLVSEGLLTRRRGAGTFVASRVEKSFSKLSSFSEDMISRGRKPHSEWVSKSAGAVTPEESLSLGLSPGALVYRFHRVRYADNTTMALEYSTIPGYCLASPEAVTSSLYDALEKTGHRPVRALQRLRAVAFLPEQAERLGVKPGDPGLFIERRGFLQDGRAAEFTQSYYRGDAYDVVAELNDIS